MTICKYVAPDGERCGFDDRLHRHCEVCGAPFQRKASAKYCSRQCNWAAWKSRQPKTPQRTLPDRLWSMVDRRSDSECWPWTGSLDGKGYGQINAGGKHGRPRRAHRVAYEALVGPIPLGMQLDHLCRNRRCVNPAHLEPVTNLENAHRGRSARGVRQCPHGSDAIRRCRDCINARRRGAA